MTNKIQQLLVIFVIVLASALLFEMARADPEGAGIEYVSNTTKESTPPGERTDPKGTITTLNLNTIQQNIKWKAYVGNVSGTLVLRDAEDYSIYEWASGGSPDGEVYMTRNNSIDWSTIQCANVTDIETEQDVLGHSSAAIDNINNTFRQRIHKAFDVGTINILQSTCKATATFVNNTEQTLAIDSKFQEVLLMDADSKIIYATLLDQDTDSYKHPSEGVTYDFQAIVPDYTSAEIATYYFYVEISG
jgi:hypothetical protein